MNMKFAAATALASSLLVLPLMQGSAQSASMTGLSKPLTSTAGTLTLVHGGGGGGGGGGHGGGGGGGGFAAVGGGGGHGGSFGGGHMGGGWGGGHIASGWGGGHMEGGHMGGRVSGWSGSRESHFASREGHLDHGQFDHGRHFDHEHDHFDHRFVRNRFFFAGGGWPYYYDYGYDCGWLRRQAAITGSPYWWSRYNACVGYY